MLNTALITANECPYFFLVDANDDSEVIKVAKKEWFSVMSIGDTYAHYGESVDTEESGDYEVLAYNFHDGHNMASVIIESLVDEDIDFEVIQDEDLILRYWKVVEDKSYDREEKGYVFYDSHDHIVTKSTWQGSWCLYEIEEK